MPYSEEGLALARARVRARENTPFPVGSATVVRESHAQLQVVCSAFHRYGVPANQRWIPRSALHPLCKLARRGDLGELVLTAKGAASLGMTTL